MMPRLSNWNSVTCGGDLFTTKLATRSFHIFVTDTDHGQDDTFLCSFLDWIQRRERS